MTRVKASAGSSQANEIWPIPRILAAETAAMLSGPSRTLDRGVVSTTSRMASTVAANRASASSVPEPILFSPIIAASASNSILQRDVYWAYVRVGTLG